jgi:hypothetical protein
MCSSEAKKSHAKNSCWANVIVALQAASRLFNSVGGRALILDNKTKHQFCDFFAAFAHHLLSFVPCRLLLARDRPALM